MTNQEPWTPRNACCLSIRLRVIACRSAAEGLKQLQAHRLDVIDSDIIMPRIDGYQFICAVRNLIYRQTRTGIFLRLRSLC